MRVHMVLRSTPRFAPPAPPRSRLSGILVLRAADVCRRRGNGWRWRRRRRDLQPASALRAAGVPAGLRGLAPFCPKCSAGGTVHWHDPNRGYKLSYTSLVQVCAVLQAVLDVVASQGLQPSPTAIFAAVMSSLDRPATQASAEVCSAPLCGRQELTVERAGRAACRLACQIA